MAIQKTIRRLFQGAGLSFLFFTIISAHADMNIPDNQFFKGVEDRIVEADAIVAGRVEMISEDSAIEPPERMVKARIHIVMVLKGSQTLQEIEFISPYSPQGYSYSGKGYWGVEDEQHSRLVECFPYDLGRPAVIFLKREQAERWAPFYAFIDDDTRKLQLAIGTIIEAEGRLATHPAREVLSPLLYRGKLLILRKYAVRAIMRHVQSWSERTEILMGAKDEISSNQDFYVYLVACVVENIQHDDASRSSAGLDLIVALLGMAPNADSLDSAVREIRKVKDAYSRDQDKAQELGAALLSSRAKLDKQGIGLSAVDKAFLEDIGLSSSQER